MAEYIKNDCEQGFVTDKAEIEYLKFNNLRHTVMGCMLGDFDTKGNYVVEPEIVKELIEMPKYIADSVENIDVCYSVIKLDKQITFFVTFEGDRVTLSLAEKMNFQGNFKSNAGMFSNINEYVLDFVETSGVVDKNAIYAKWHISPYTGSALDVFDMDEETLAKYFGLVNRFKYLMQANNILLQNENALEEAETNYAVNMLNILKGYPKLKQAVDKKINEVVNQQPSIVRLDKPGFAKTINEIIVQTVEANQSVLSEKEQQQFEAEQHNAKVDYNIRRAQIVEISNAKSATSDAENVELQDTSKCVIETLGRENGQTLQEVASNYLATKKQVALDKTQQAKTLLTTRNEGDTRQTLLDEIVGITGKKVDEIAPKIVSEEVVEEIKAKITENDNKNLIVKATENNTEATNAKGAGAKTDDKKSASATNSKTGGGKTGRKTGGGGAGSNSKPKKGKENQNNGSGGTVNNDKPPITGIIYDSRIGEGNKTSGTEDENEYKAVTGETEAEIREQIAKGLYYYDKLETKKYKVTEFEQKNDLNNTASQTETKVTTTFGETGEQKITQGDIIAGTGEHIEETI